MRAPRGFTLIEMAVVLAIIAVVAATGYQVARTGKQNADLGSAAYEIAIRMGGQRAEALADGRDRVVVLVDAPGNDGRSCGTFSDGACTLYFVLRDPTAAWTLNGFVPSSPATNAQLVERRALPKGVRFHLPAAGAHPARPFQGVTMLDPDLLGTCDGRNCVAVRFSGDGVVSPVFPAAASTKSGLAVVLGSNATDSPASERKGLLVGFPTGIVRTFPF